MQPFEPEAIVWIQQTLGPRWEGVVQAVSLLGGTWGVLLACGVVFWLWGRWPLYGLLVLVVLEAVVKKAAAAAFFVERPDAAGVLKYESVEGVSSFPSGHVSTATALWAWPAARGLLSWGWPLAVALGISVARLYLGVHYVVDVVAGAILGTAVAWAAARTWPRLREWAARPSFAVWVGVAVVIFLVAVGSTFFGGTRYRWNAAGGVAALALALPLEHVWLRWSPPAGGRVEAARRVLVGVAGLVALVVAERTLGGDALWFSAVTTFLGGLWVLLGAPWLFVRLGWGATERREAPTTGRA